MSKTILKLEILKDEDGTVYAPFEIQPCSGDELNMAVDALHGVVFATLFDLQEIPKDKKMEFVAEYLQNVADTIMNEGPDLLIKKDLNEPKN